MHEDASFGIKLQIPLINIKHNNGPIELFPMEHSIKGICASIKGTVPVGTAILYQQIVWHRGTRNDNMKIRPVIDMSFLHLNEHLETRYFRVFGKKAANDMAKNQQIFYEYCDKSDNCPGTKKTYVQKSWTKKDEFKRIEALAKAKAKARARESMYGY